MIATAPTPANSPFFIVILSSGEMELKELNTSKPFKNKVSDIPIFAFHLNKLSSLLFFPFPLTIESKKSFFSRITLSVL